ncbi:MAG: hypothetical protein HFH15_10865 [Ruminococcus sp.]|jgi:hypothetical protein|nr:hypothetical protein [Ruminococcus sp.]
MKKELDYFRIGNSYGGNQDWFLDFMMKIGGCAALTACDSCIYLDLYKGTELYPYAQDHLTKKDYIRFGMHMKPYLRPRWSGVDTLDIYIEGFQKYLADRGCENIGMTPFYGNRKAAESEKVLKEQIDKGFPVPCLLLNHKSRALKDYEWHWFLLTGYEIFEKICMVKAVTYGGWQWLDFNELWNTGYQRRGGLVLYTMEEKQ